MDKLDIIVFDSKVCKAIMDKLNQLSSDLKTCRQLLEEKQKVLEEREEMKKDWLETNEVVELLGISERTLLRLRRKKILPYSRIGKKVIYPIQELKAYISETTKNKY